MTSSGPKLWDNTISLPFELDPFGVFDIQDVPVENGIKVQTIFGVIVLRPIHSSTMNTWSN